MTPSSDLIPGEAESRPVHVEGHGRRALDSGWEAAHLEGGRSAEIGELGTLDWVAAAVPGTAAGALRRAGRWRPGDRRDFDAEEWWFRTTFDAVPPGPGEEALLHLGGIATVAEVYLNGELLMKSESMFASHTLALGERLGARNELVIRCLPLGPLLRERRRPRARWRTRLVAEGNLRFFRTMLLGRAPGFAPAPAAVGPWRAVSLEHRRGLSVEEIAIRPSVEDDDGVVSVSLRLHLPAGSSAPDELQLELDGPSGRHSARMTIEADGDERSPRMRTARGELRVPGVALWWPHTHGEPVLHELRLLVREEKSPTVLHTARVGFRALAPAAREGHELERDGLDLHINGVRVFARGAIWTPLDLVDLAPEEQALRARLTLVRDGGMNMLRLAGTGAYETDAFHDLCDELGIMVWQDFMFANLDYPISDERFRTEVLAEASGVLRALGGRTSLTVLCGNSEIEQQVSMLGLESSLGRGELFGELLPDLVRESGVDAVYVPSAPCGGDPPFRVDRGIANYYGVGGYRRELKDARHAGVRFAAECLAFSNVPDEEAIAEMLPEAPGRLAGHHPVWKAGIPRDVGADWDFEDVRDHYLRLLFGVDVPELRRVDGERYLELSRQLTGEIMAEVFGEWRRSESSCGGALVLWLGDVLPGAGWGLIDHRGLPKLAYHHLRRALAPVAVWTVDEGLNGVAIHVANDRPTPLTAQLRVSLYRDGELDVGGVDVPIEIAPHSQDEWNLETLVGRFLDASWAYRFGPPAQDAIVVSVEGPGVLSQSFRFPAGRPLRRESPEQLGLTARIARSATGETKLTISSRRLAYGVRLHGAGTLASDDGFSVEPGGQRTVALRAHHDSADPAGIRVGAINMSGLVKPVVESPPR